MSRGGSRWLLHALSNQPNRPRLKAGGFPGVTRPGSSNQPNHPRLKAGGFRKSSDMEVASVRLPTGSVGDLSSPYRSGYRVFFREAW